MNDAFRSLLVSKIVAVFCLLTFWFSQFQIQPLRAATWPTQWGFECIRDESSGWWQSLRVQTVPGVLYRLQVSESLESGSWSTLESVYGFGGEWICPLMRGHEPVISLPAGQPVIPQTPANPIRLAYLVMEKTVEGELLVSWCSLDDYTAKRMVIPGVTLDPVWDEFDASYMNQYGNHFFALTPNLYNPVSFNGPSPALGTLDSAMISEFTGAIPAITENIANSVAMRAHYSHQIQPDGARKFYRIAADWSLDSDSDGHPDWQELVFDGNNPFAADTDGDGIPDQAAGNGGTTAGAYPEPTDAEPSAPVAVIEQLTIAVKRVYASSISSPSNDGISVYTQHAISGMDGAQFKSHTTYSGLKSAVDSMAPPPSWSGILECFTCMNDRQSHGEGEEMTILQGAIGRFRLRLDSPAPEGGYRIPLRIGIVYQEVDFPTTRRSVPSPHAAPGNPSISKSSWNARRARRSAPSWKCPDLKVWLKTAVLLMSLPV